MPPKIKILQIIPNLKRGGAEKVCLQISSGLNKEAYDSAILLFKDDEQETSWREEYQASGGQVFILKKNELFDWHNLYQIYKTIKGWQPDIVHTHLGGDIYGIIAAKLAGVKKIITTEHNLNVSEKKTTRIIKKICLKLADKVVAVSEAVRSDATERYCLDQNKISVIYNGLPFQDFKDQADPVNNPVTIGSLGRLMPQKGFEILIKAVSLTKNQNYQLIIGGEGELQNALEEQIKTAGLEKMVKLLGRVNGSEFWPKIDIFILSSLWEGLGLVVLEAGARRKPVIVSKLDGLKEIISPENGYLFEPGDAQDLADKIDYLLENLNSPEVASKINNNYQNILEKFSAKKMISAYEEVYKNLVSKYENTTGK